MNYTKDYLSFGAGIGLSLLSDWFADLQIIVLQKLFYILSIAILFIALVRMLKKKKRENSDFIDSIASTQKAVQIAEMADDPETKGKKVLSIIQLIKQGGINMKVKLSGLGKLQWVSFIATVLLLVLGFVSSAFNIPELAVFADKLDIIFIAAGISAVPGIFSKGKQIGAVVEKVLPTKEKKAIQAKIRELVKKKEALAIKYKPFIDAFNDISTLGGKLTADEQLKHDTYVTQVAAVEKLIATEEAKLGVSNDAQIV